MQFHIDVPNTFEGEAAFELLWEYIQGRGQAPSGLNEYQYSDPKGGPPWTVTEIRTALGWHWFIRHSEDTQQVQAFASAYVTERRSETPGAADPGYTPPRESALGYPVNLF